MYQNLYWVLLTEKHFGVFRIEADTYPTEFIQNMKCVETVAESDLKRFLIENVGRNTLINSDFDLIFDIGKLCSRTPY